MLFLSSQNVKGLKDHLVPTYSFQNIVVGGKYILFQFLIIAYKHSYAYCESFKQERQHNFWIPVEWHNMR